MSASRSIDSWRQVESRQGFAAYLGFLAFDCEQACSGQEAEPPTVSRWTNRTIDGLLWGWAGLLGGRLDGTDLLHEEAPDRPGWQGLAYQLDIARTISPGFNLVLADSEIEPNEVDTPRDLRRYVATLATDFARDQEECQAKIDRGQWAGDGGSWAHSTLYDWLGAWAAWVGANSPRHAQLEPVTWRSVALQLSVARIYE
ncbi:hypothetical protein ACFV2X_47560 [Streptomyces sp. NPDC059679]|uniref:hypothetical protein n=1 Tax=Streptomyces sp. NPDC059679 TaxID=3346903 RepID=UPI00369F9D5B